MNDTSTELDNNNDSTSDFKTSNEAHASAISFQKQYNPWMLVALVLIGIIVGYGISLLMGIKGLTTSLPNPVQENIQKDPSVAKVPEILSDEQTQNLPEDDAIIGSPNAPVTLVEFSDFQCPYCGAFFKESLAQLTADFIDTGKVKLIYRDYPLSGHPQAVGAAHAAECADDQKKFKEMHDALFEGQKEWSGSATALETYEKYAQKIDLNLTEYKECMASQKHIPEIRKDLLDGLAVGVKGTPHFFINGHRVSGSLDYATVFKPAIEATLAGKGWKLDLDPLTGNPFVVLQ